MTEKIPPPRLLTGPQFEGFNRWLLELTSILNSEGDIDPDAIAGLPSVYAQTGNNSADIITLFTAVNDLVAAVNALQSQINTLSARAQVFNGVGAPSSALGSVNDWYANVGGGVGARIYIKTGVATWTAFPF